MEHEDAFLFSVLRRPGQTPQEFEAELAVLTDEEKRALRELAAAELGSAVMGAPEAVDGDRASTSAVSEADDGASVRA